jgi:hypothetical protein
MDEVEGKYISLPLTMETREEDVQYIAKCIKAGW